jgi:hypothetical protein
MQDFQTIAHLIPSFDDSVDDPPVAMAAQSILHDIFGALLGQSKRYIQPVLFKSGRLVVYAHASVWGQHIQHRRERLMQQCQAAGLHVTEIKVKVIPDAVSGASQNNPRPSTYDATKASEHLDKLAKQLDKKELQATVSRLAERIRQNHKEKTKQK